MIDDGVYFDTSTFPSYAEFAHLDLDALRAGARVEQNLQKRNPADFALWKFSPIHEQRDMEWDSPWGKGFPGWHIECSAMALAYLGDTIDIHTGGIDHIPVHHTNEIAQSEAATGKRFANYWLHANFLLVNGTKISKSLGNGFTLDDLREKGFSPRDFRMFVLQSQYRTESNFTWENLAAAQTRLQHWRTIACLRHQMHETLAKTTHTENHVVLAAKQAALEAVNADLNSPRALTVYERVFDTIEQAAPEVTDREHFVALLEHVDDLLGLELLPSTPDIDDTAKQLILERTRARENKDWQRSDELREQLATSGIGLNDTESGVRWYYV